MGTHPHKKGGRRSPRRSLPAEQKTSIPQPPEQLRAQWKRFAKCRRKAQKALTARNVHSFRVAARRLLAWQHLMANVLDRQTIAGNCEALNCALEATGKLRDAQFQAAAVRSWHARFPAVKSFRKWLCKREQTLLCKAQKKFKKAGAASWKKRADREYKELCRTCRKQGIEAVYSVMLRELRNVYAGTVSLREKARDVKSVHQARIAFKKFRYMAEALCPAASPDLLAGMRCYQQCMGNVQDNAMLLQSFEKYARKAGAAVPVAELEAFRNFLTAQLNGSLREFLGHPDALEAFSELFEREAA